MKQTTIINICFCNECPHFSNGRDEMSKYCYEGVDLTNVEYNAYSEIIIPDDCPLEDI